MKQFVVIPDAAVRRRTRYWAVQLPPREGLKPELTGVEMRATFDGGGLVLGTGETAWELSREAYCGVRGIVDAKTWKLHPADQPSYHAQKAKIIANPAALENQHIDRVLLVPMTAAEYNLVRLVSYGGLVPKIAQKKSRIDARTRQLIAAGFEWCGHRFSLSSEAQLNHARWLHTSAPVYVSTIDGQRVELATSEVIEKFCQAAATALDAILDTGRRLKARANVAKTIEELDAVKDERQ